MTNLEIKKLNKIFKSIQNMNTINRVFIRNLPHEITEKQLLNEFQRFGTITDYSLKADRGIAFISFKSQDSYNNCLNMNDKLKISGRIIGIWEAQPAQYDGPNNDNYNNNSNENINSRQYSSDCDTIFVGNIPNNVEDFEVREAFIKYKPYEVKMGDSDDHKIQYALIRILDHKLLDGAIQNMNGYFLKGSKITVSVADQSIH